MAKLSAAQTKALTEVYEHGVTNARKNTFDSIEKFTMETGDPVRVLALNEEGYKALGLEWLGAVSTESNDDGGFGNTPDAASHPYHNQVPESVESLATYYGNHDTSEEMEQGEWVSNFTEVLGWEPDSREEFLPATSDDTSLFRDMLKKNDLMGQWRNSEEAWGNVSLAEIKEDIKTAHPINRAAKRAHKKVLRSEFRKLFSIRPRKATRITGKVGV